jgi:hypothetical protein
MNRAAAVADRAGPRSVWRWTLMPDTRRQQPDQTELAKAASIITHHHLGPRENSGEHG